ncbi:MAG: hypothetical protein A2Z72_07010 [Omnitrophica bacterium RBG_13_46_9]|nr:MAG: hypothetical protein A2Z72_07010 [Omnitrophica bacterium RBG_13_46_9]
MKKHYLFITLFVTGGSVMIIELIGTRVIAPVYGTGLFVWASLITVALTCLSIGYWMGGKIADKKPDFKMFYLIILAAGILIAPVSQVSQPVLRWSMNLGFRVGPLFSAYILFTVPMVLLGMVSPYAIRLAATELDVLGTTAGRLYAISTLGSFAGTILTGFVLIPSFGTRKILFMQSSVLILLWVGYYFVNRRYKHGFVQALFLFFPALCFSTNLFALMEPGDLRLIYKAESFYGQIKIIENGREREIYVDNMKQSSIDKNTYLPTVKVYYGFEMLPLFNRNGKDACLIGLAGANIPRRLWEYGIETDCVDIEPKMERIARKYFGFLDYFGKIHITDGRVFINKNKKKYDFVIVDVFTGDDIPFYLITEESFREIRAVLKEGGIIGINFIGEVYGKNSAGWKSVYKTLSAVFSHVRAYSFIKGAEVTDSTANVIFFASDSELLIPQDYRTYCRNPVSQRLIELLLECELDTGLEGGMVLTDDYAPVEFIRKDTARKIRQKKLVYAPEGYFLE